MSGHRVSLRESSLWDGGADFKQVAKKNSTVRSAAFAINLGVMFTEPRDSQYYRVIREIE